MTTSFTSNSPTQQAVMSLYRDITSTSESAMKDNIIEAGDAAKFTAEALRRALIDAAHENPATGMLLEGMVSRACELQREIDRLASLV